MNRRQKKKADNIHRAKLHRILDQVLDINGLESRQKSKTGDQPTAFFWFNGNTGVTDVIVHYTGWDYDSKADFTKRVALIGALEGYGGSEIAFTGDQLRKIFDLGFLEKKEVPINEAATSGHSDITSTSF